MKKAYLLLTVSFIVAASYGQSLQRIVINATGGNIGETGSPQMILSVGEPIIGLSWVTGTGLAQGFLGGSKTVSSPSGIETIDIENAVVYPNPFSTSIRINSDLDNIHVSIYNNMGQEVYNGIYESNGINLSQLAPGIYIIHASSNQQIISNTKLLKL